MSRTIDERVVEMRFNNKEFEAHAKESISTLSKLKEALNISTKNSAKSLEGLDKAAKNVSLEGIAAGVEALEKRFSTLGIVGMRVIQNLTDSMMNTLGRGVSFVTDSIVSGGIRRAMNIENAHFQLQALLKDEEKVQAIMDDAMKSVDGTAYAYDEAAKAASQFAASGIEAGDEMLNALRGIVGVSAMTNSEFEGISQIFTTVAGNGRLMGDQLLQLGARGLNAAATIADFVNGVTDGSKQASAEVTALVKNITKGSKITQGDIRELVSKGQISFKLFSEAMTDAFADSAERANETFTGALSNIKSALARIGAGFISPLVAQNSEVVSLFNAVRERINDVKKALVFDEELGNVNALSKQFTDAVLSMAKYASEFIRDVDLSKPMEIFHYWVETIKNLGKGLFTFLKPLGQAFREVFLSFSLEDVSKLSSKISEITSKMRFTEEGSRNLKDAFKGIFDIIKLLGDGFLSLLSALLPVEKPINSLSNGILELAGSMGRSLSQFAEWARNSDIMATIYDLIKRGLDSAANSLNLFIDKLKMFIGSMKELPFVKNFIESINSSLNNMEGFLNKVEIRFHPFTSALSFLLGAVNKLAPSAVAIFNGLGKAISFVINSISKALGSAGFNSILDVFNFSVLVGVGTQFSKFLENLNKTVNSAGGLFSGFKGIIANITKTFQELQTTLKAETLKKIAISLALVVGSLFVLSMIDSEKLTSSLGAVTVLLLEMTAILDHLNAFDKKTRQMKTSGLVALSASVLILVTALKKISEIDSDRLLSSIGIITVLLGEMTGVAILLSKYGGKIRTGSLGIISFSAAIYILTASVKKLGEMDTDVLLKGLLAVGAVLSELSLFMMSAEFGKFKPSQALAIVILSSSLLILQNAVEGFGRINTEVLLKGIVAVGAVLAEIATFSLAAGEAKHILSTSVSLILMAKALEILQGPFTTFGSMEISTIGKGLLAMGGALVEIALAMKLIPKNSLIIGTGLLMVAQSLIKISEAFSQMSSLKWGEIGKGFVVLGGSMIILAVALNKMKGTLGASVAMLALATALTIFVPVLKSLSQMKIGDIVKGLLTLAAAFLVIGGGATLLSGAIPAMLGLSGALVLLGIAVAAAGVGVMALSVGLATLAASGIAGAAALIEVIKILTVGVLTTIRDSAAAFGEMVKTLILTMCDVIVECAPTIVDTILEVVKAVMKSLADNAPEIVSDLLRLIIGVIDALAANLPTVIQAVVNLFMQFFAGVIQALEGINTDVLIEGITGIGLIASIMLALAALTSLAPGAMVGVLAMGAVIAELTILLAAIGLLSQIPGLNWLIGEGGHLLESIGSAIGGFFGSIVENFAVTAFGALPQIGDSLTGFMESAKPFFDWIGALDESALNGTKILAQTILALTAGSILDGLTSWFTGGVSLEDFGEELVVFGPKIKKYANSVSGMDGGVVEASANAALALANMATKLPNSGGLAAKIFGDNSLAEFGEELAKFGPLMRAYSVSVTGMNTEVVEASANAAQVLSDMATKLPNSGGLAAKILGDNTLSSFGEELAKFGPLMRAYSISVTGMNGDVVEASAKAATALSELANGLPNSGGLVSWFTGDNDIGSFGESLVEFGKGLSAYSDSVSGINAFQMAMVLEEVKKLIEIAQGISQVDTFGMTNFSTSLAQMGATGIEEFLAAFTDSGTRVANAINTMLTTALAGIQSYDSTFQAYGIKSVNYYLTGIRLGSIGGINAALTLASSVINTLDLQIPNFLLKGSSSATQYLTGIKNKYPEANSTGKTLANNVLAGIQSVSFYEAGVSAGQGFANGLKSTTNLATAAGKAIGDAAYNATKTSLKSNSPSKKMAELGDYAGVGFVNALMYFVAKAASAGEDLGDATVDGVSSAINSISRVITDDMIDDPVIRPTVDLTNLQKSISDINTLFNSAIMLNSIQANGISEVIASRGSRNNIDNIQNGASGGTTNYFNFNQTNNSPKALSRIDVYRQTNNQFARFKREVESRA